MKTYLFLACVLLGFNQIANAQQRSLLNKGNFDLITVGAGVLLKKNYGLDFAYTFPPNNNAFGHTFKLTLSVYLGQTGTY